MTEEYELYAPDSEASDVIVVYRGEEDYSPLYLDLRELENSVPVRAEGQPWGDYDAEAELESYDEPVNLVLREQVEEVEKEAEDGEKKESEENEDDSEIEIGDLDEIDVDEDVLIAAGVLAGMFLMYVFLELFGSGI
jgi:small nuclear ribonucleoprotein (snRNP)-like protein